MGKVKVEDLIFWGLIVFAIIILVWRIFGHSPSLEQLAAALIGSELLLWRYMYRQGREIEHIKTKLDKLDAIEGNLQEIKQKLT